MNEDLKMGSPRIAGELIEERNKLREKVQMLVEALRLIKGRTEDFYTARICKAALAKVEKK